MTAGIGNGLGKQIFILTRILKRTRGLQRVKTDETARTSDRADRDSHLCQELQELNGLYG